MKIILRLIFILFLASNNRILGQNNVGIGTNAPNPSSILELQAIDKGLLIPRVALVAKNNNAPIGAGVATSLFVYNTATAGVAPNDVYPGFYYWDGARWVRYVDFIVERYYYPPLTINPFTTYTLTALVPGVTSFTTAIVNLAGDWPAQPNVTIEHVESRTGEVRFRFTNNTLGTTYYGMDFIITIIR